MAIKIGETHEVWWRVPPFQYRGPDSEATEAVKRQIDAHENLLIAIGMGWDLDGVIEQSKAALSSFTTTD